MVVVMHHAVPSQSMLISCTIVVLSLAQQFRPKTRVATALTS
jgi:hypothetical protein